MAEVRGSKRVTLAELQEYFALEVKRKALKRQSDDIAKLQKDLEAKFARHVDANGGAERSVVTCGYRIYFQLKNGSVGWKDEFLHMAKLAGFDPLKEAEKRIAAAPKKEELVVEEPEENES